MTTTHHAAALIRSTERGSLWPALAIAAIAFLIGAVAEYAPPATGEMAVVFLPGTDEATAYGAILAAGGRFVAPTHLSNIVVAYALDPGFQDRIRQSGGFLTLAAKGLCTPVPTTTSSAS